MSEARERALIIGGRSGLGWTLTTALAKTHDVFYTGRHGPRKLADLKGRQPKYLHLNIGGDMADFLTEEVARIAEQVRRVDLLIYATTARTKGKEPAKFDDKAALTMMQVNFGFPLLFLEQIRKQQKTLPALLVITSAIENSKPDVATPIYVAAKAGLKALAHTHTRNGGSIRKALVAVSQPVVKILDEDVLATTAENLLQTLGESFEYKAVRLHFDPPRIEETD